MKEETEAWKTCPDWWPQIPEEEDMVNRIRKAECMIFNKEMS